MQKIPSPQRQTGITLMEALVAIVVTALGVLGILGSQLRTLADTQTSVHRAQAIRLIEDLSERMRANPNARLAYPVGGGVNNLYWISDWDQMPPVLSDDYCSVNQCDLRQLANYDMQQWKKSVSALLPQGAAKTWKIDDSVTGTERQLQLAVLIAWRENEKEDGVDYKNAIDYIRGVSSESCQSGKTCHVQYISIATRCYDGVDTSDALICP